MAPRLSTRISLRWLDEPPSEPTITTVLSVGSRFLDLRVGKADNGIDWAFAGRREIVSQDPLRCRWYHVIDSRNVFDPDEGAFQKLPNGDDLETGSMPCPERNNKVTPYEEVWRAISLPQELNFGWILQGDHPDSTTFLGRAGPVFLALKQRKDGTFSASKEELVSHQDQPPQWRVQYASGEPPLPSLARLGTETFAGEEAWRLGQKVEIERQIFVVVAVDR